MESKIAQQLTKEIKDVKSPIRIMEKNSTNLKTTIKNLKTETIDKIVIIKYEMTKIIF